MVGSEIDRYRIVEKLGEGSLGTVYKAVDTMLDRDVAIKIIHPELAREPDFLQRIRTAIRATANLNHSNLATYHTFLLEGSAALIVMEYVDGETFEQLVARRGPIHPGDAIPLFEQALHGIGYAHSQGVLHGDIKLANLMISRRGIVKVMDFGFAKVLQPISGPPDFRSDVFSLGATLYEMLTAHKPSPAPLSPDIPRYVESAVRKALDKDPAARFQTAEEFAAALRPPADLYLGPILGSAPTPYPTSFPSPCPDPPPSWPMSLPPPPLSAPEPEKHRSIFGALKRGIAELRRSRLLEGERESKPQQTPELPGGRIDRVHFSVTAPQFLSPAKSSEVYVWAHLDQDRAVVMQRARDAIGQPLTVKSKGPVALARGTTLTVALRIDSVTVENPEETILWEAEIGNAAFIVTVPSDAAGEKKGSATFYAHGLQIARLNFVLEIGASSAIPAALNTREQRINKAFASYATPDRDEVLARVQGIQKAAPGLEIFLDVVSLRSGQDWEKELRRHIPENDVFYLFWSANAKNSEWVEKEWRCALETRGLEFIDPVPLVSPDLAPPPAELASKHFNDWVLAFRRKPQ